MDDVDDPNLWVRQVMKARQLRIKEVPCVQLKPLNGERPNGHGM